MSRRRYILVVSIEYPLAIHLLEASHRTNATVEELEKFIERKFLFEKLCIVSDMAQIVLENPFCFKLHREVIKEAMCYILNEDDSEVFLTDEDLLRSFATEYLQANVIRSQIARRTTRLKKQTIKEIINKCIAKRLSRMKNTRHVYESLACDLNTSVIEVKFCCSEAKKQCDLN